MLVILGLPFMMVAGALVALLVRCARGNARLHSILEKLHKMLFFSLFLRMAITTYIAFCVGAHYGSMFQLD